MYLYASSLDLEQNDTHEINPSQLLSRSVHALMNRKTHPYARKIGHCLTHLWSTTSNYSAILNAVIIHCDNRVAITYDVMTFLR
jgi:hypothetical protein